MATKKMKKFLFAILAIAIVGLIIFIGSLAFVIDQYSTIKQTLPSAEKLLNYQHSVPTLIYSRDGEKIGELFTEKRYPIEYEKISKNVVNAFLAAEDSRFFSHGGIDYQGILRAGIRYFTAGGKQGGSTITQQVAKNLLLTKERTIQRKLKDILLAFEIEKIMSKEKILTLYLNTIFLGNNSYGIEAAARNYYRKSQNELTLAEAAMIAGLPPAPSAYAPNENFQRAKARQKFVLDQMLKNKMITIEEMESAWNEVFKVYTAESPNTNAAPYFFFEVKKQLEQDLQLPNLGTEGYSVHTTLDLNLQKYSQEIINKSLETYEAKKGFKGPLKRHGNSFEPTLEKIVHLPLNDEGIEKAIVVDLIPELDAVAMVGQTGPGLLILEDHRWALRTSKLKKSNVLDFANILAIGDEIHVKRIARKTPKRFMDPFAQKRLEVLDTYKKYFPQIETINYYTLTDKEGIEVSALFMDGNTGEVLVMIGGEGFDKSQFNRATQAKRQVGSSVKGLYYAFAIDQGFMPASLVDSPPIVIGDWKPENYTKEFLGRMTLRNALINSYNIPSIQLFSTLGASQVLEFFKKLGMPWQNAELSLALGAGDATLLQMVRAYSVFSNGGKVAEPVYIKKIEDRFGKVLMEYPDPKLLVLAQPKPLENNTQVTPPTIQKAKATPLPQKTGDEVPLETIDPSQILSPQAAYIGYRLLQDVVRFGTGSRASAASRGAAGKTGTTNGYTDAWFVGLTPNLVGGVWMGFDDARKSLGNQGTGGVMAAPVWRDIAKEALKTYTYKGVDVPEGVYEIRIDPLSGQPTTQGGVFVPVRLGFGPGSPRLRHALGLTGQAAAPGETPSVIDEDASRLRALD